ncbi:hypothetical protein ACIBF5_27450 [Micromonospora sp. NPDC050417]|uniref:hypothetical protein n=1 Tax=Micromonospora sp. NPDC050417 TaxID=3364280 RepID=UPI00378F4D2D
MACLRECGLIGYRPVGCPSFCLTGAEQLDLLVTTGFAVDLYANYGNHYQKPERGRGGT